MSEFLSTVRVLWTERNTSSKSDNNLECFSMVRPRVKWPIYYCCVITSNSTGCLNMIWLAQELAARPRDFRKWPRVIKIPDKVLFELCQSGCIVQSTSVASTICFNKNSQWYVWKWPRNVSFVVVCWHTPLEHGTPQERNEAPSAQRY